MIVEGVTKLPRQDHRGSPIAVIVDDAGLEYTLVSYGEDHTQGGPADVRAVGPTTNFRDDIVFSAGSSLARRPHDVGDATAVSIPGDALDQPAAAWPRRIDGLGCTVAFFATPGLVVTAPRWIAGLLA